MHFSSESEIHFIAEGMINKTLPKSQWTHAAHFAVAVWLLRNERYDAFAEMPDFIRNYNEASGTPNTDTEGYHETITIASLLATKSFVDCQPKHCPLHEIVNGILESDLADPGWLFQYWSKDCLFSVQARREWVEPDLAPLPYTAKEM